jgi:hypothetical protein
MTIVKESLSLRFKIVVFVILLLTFHVNNSLYANQCNFDYFLENYETQTHSFTYMYDEENNNLAILKNGLWLQSIIVPNEIEAVLDGPICMLFFVKVIKNENNFIGEFYQHHVLDFIYGDPSLFYNNLLRKLRRLKLYIFDKEQEELFCDENIDCFLNLPKHAYKSGRCLNLKVRNPNKIQPDCIRIELPEC